MTVSAHDVAAVLRERLPGLNGLKLHKLLYYTQAHHLAAVDEPLFSEWVMAWDWGPVVATVWGDEKAGRTPPPRRKLSSGQLNIVDYVVSRYGMQSGPDLMHMTHGEAPWKTANASREPGGSVRIRNEWMRDYFRDEPHDEGEIWFSREKIAELTAGAEQRREWNGPIDRDEPDRLWELLDEEIGKARA